MAGYRRKWMSEMIAREVRIFDAQTMGTLRQGTSFFASTSVIAIGGTLALIGNADQLAGVAQDLTEAPAPRIVWEMKLLANPSDPSATSFAHKAAELNISAARSFNRGLRAIYFGLAAVAWLAGAIPLIIAAFVTCGVIWRREFASVSRKVLLEDGS